MAVWCKWGMAITYITSDAEVQEDPEDPRSSDERFLIGNQDLPLLFEMIVNFERGWGGVGERGRAARTQTLARSPRPNAPEQ